MAGDIKTASGTKISIGPAVGSNIDTTAEFDALAWVEIALVENAGEFGDESAAVTGAALGDGRIRKAKGARDAGTQSIVVFHDPQDPGQLAAIAAEGTNQNYAFKVEVPDAPAATAPSSWTNTVFYYRGLVMSQRLNIGTNDNIMRRTFNVGVNSQIYKKAGVFTT